MAYSVKPGRGPSLMGGIGGLIVAGFGLFWVSTASKMNAPGPAVGFGVIFILVALGGAFYSFYNAGSRERMSSFDITTPGEEGDPIARALGHEKTPKDTRDRASSEPKRKIPGAFCPYCGHKVEQQFDYCPQCGKDI